jgi:uncharacterized membrane protein
MRRWARRAIIGLETIKVTTMRACLPFAFVAAATLAACQPAATPAPALTTPDVVPAAPPAHPSAQALPPVRGQFVIGKDGYGITLCGETTQHIVGLDGQAKAFVDEAANKGLREFFVEGFGSTPAAGGGSIDRIERAYTEGPACKGETTPFLFKAVGTEPFWSAAVAQGTLSFERPDAPAVTGDFGGSPMHGDQRRFFANTATGPLEIQFTRATCTDGMSDSLYAWTAVAKFDGKEWKGCGYAGE